VTKISFCHIITVLVCCGLWSHHCYRFLQASESEWLEISEDDDEGEDEADDDDDDDESGEDADQTDEDEVYLST
jgi:hypothetical protein